MKSDEIIDFIRKGIAPPMPKIDALNVAEEVLEWLEATVEALTEEIDKEERESLARKEKP